MKSISRFAVAVCVAAALLQPSTAIAKTREDRTPGLRETVVKALKLIQKTFGITANDDIPTPPKP